MTRRRGRLFSPIESIFRPSKARQQRAGASKSNPVKIPIYDEEERDLLRTASRFNSQLMDFLRPHIRAGITTIAIDQLATDYTRDHGHTPACLGYLGYPKAICTSINEVVCHGIPDATVLRPGDIVNVDLTTIVNGWHGDQSETFMIGEVSEDARQLVQAAFEALFVGIRAAKPHGPVSLIGQAIYDFAKVRELGVVREYQGHGIGREFHQDPGIPHFPEARSRKHILQPGMCFTVEPMLNRGSWRTQLNKQDGWTVRTLDHKLSAQFEHTILMTESGPEIMTLTKTGPQEGDVVKSSF